MSDIVWHHHLVSKQDRIRIKNHPSKILWFTGLSGSGKSTLANYLELYLNKNRIHTYLLDGDNIRHGLNRDLNFSDEDRMENIRRVGEVGKLFVDAGIFTIVCFISPFKKDRQLVRELFSDDEFKEIYISTPIEVCETRDPKGLYKKARSGELKNFTGIDSKYEPPDNPDIVIDTSKLSIDEGISEICFKLGLVKK